MRTLTDDPTGQWAPWWNGLPFLPCTVLDARSGAWQRRKRAWRAVIGDGPVTAPAGASRFDPVLAQLVYRWWARPDDVVLDPFAGGATRGLVAAHEHVRYVGVDIRPDQVAVNREQLTGKEPAAPTWLVGDSRHLDALSVPAQADLLFTCPPYADLERYSRDSGDLSTLTGGDFHAAHVAIIRRACARLADDRFAVWVVGESTASDGGLAGIVPSTIAAFDAAGMRHVTHAVMVTPMGNLHVRTGRPFWGARTLSRAHQHVLVFVKGDPAAAAGRLGRRAAAEVPDIAAKVET